MSFEHEISDTKRTLELLEEEKKNLTKHFELQIQDKLSALKKLLEAVEQEKDLICQLKIQEENYFSTVQSYMKTMEKFVQPKDEKIDTLLKEKCLLEAKILGEEGPVLQYKF